MSMGALTRLPGWLSGGGCVPACVRCSLRDWNTRVMSCVKGMCNSCGGSGGAQHQASCPSLPNSVMSCVKGMCTSCGGSGGAQQAASGPSSGPNAGNNVGTRPSYGPPSADGAQLPASSGHTLPNSADNNDGEKEASVTQINTNINVTVPLPSHGPPNNGGTQHPSSGDGAQHPTSEPCPPCPPCPPSTYHHARDDDNAEGDDDDDEG